MQKGLVLLALLVLAATALLWVAGAVLAGWLERRIIQQLEANDIQVHDLEVRDLSWSRCDLSSIKLGPGAALQIDSVRLTFDLTSLRQARPASVEIGGVSMHMTALWLQWFQHWAETRLDPPESWSRSGATQGLTWPFGRLDFPSLLLDYPTAAGRLQTVISGHAEATPEGGLQAAGALRSAFVSAAWEGRTGKSANDMVFDVGELEVYLPGLAALLDREFARIPMAGPLRGSVNVRRESAAPDRFHVRFHLDQALAAPFAPATGGPPKLTAAGTAWIDVSSGALGLEGWIRPQPSGFRLGDVEASYARAELCGSAERDPSGSLRGKATLRLVGGRVESAGPWRADGLEVDLTATLDEGLSVRGRVTAEDVRVGDIALGGARMVIQGIPPEVTAGLHIDLLGPPEVNVAIRLLQQGFRVDAAVNPFALEDSPRLKELLDRRLGGSILGTIAARVTVDPSSAQPYQANLRLKNVTMGNTGLTVEGLQGDIALRGPRLLCGFPRQELTIAKLITEKITLSNGRVRLAMRDLDRFFIEENQWEWAGGRVSSKPFVYQPSLRSVRTEIICERIGVDHVLQLLFGDTVTGTGELFGRVPIAFQWDPLRFSIEGGYLHAAPGKYLLQVRDRAVADQLLKAATQGGGHTKQQKQLQDRILQSLKDFEYQVFRLDFREQHRGFPSGVLHVEGAGTGDVGVPLVLNLRFAGISDE